MWYHLKMSPDEIVIANVVQTSFACPSQWDAWTADGQYLYMRFRHGYGSVRAEEGPDLPGPGEPYTMGPVVASFDHGDALDGCMELEEFCELAGIRLADDVRHVAYSKHFAQMLRTVTEEANSDDLDMD